MNSDTLLLSIYLAVDERAQNLEPWALMQYVDELIEEDNPITNGLFNHIKLENIQWNKLL